VDCSIRDRERVIAQAPASPLGAYIMTAQPPAIAFRLADAMDLPAIVRLLADDPLGAGREQYADPLPDDYLRAFAAMQAQPGNDLLLATLDGAVVGCLQLTIIPGLSRRGATRAQIEGVRIDASRRGARIGEALVTEAIARAERAGCALVQLTTDVTREEARRFYERLGFVPSHIGMKRALNAP
jgi:ribosomal protein S18 acetylase RimI-like enzyme